MIMPNYISGNKFTDDRGVIRFVNDFALPKIKRFYTVEHLKTDVIRAWQGHEIETKYFSVLKGEFVVAWVEIDDFENPSENLKANYKLLSSNEPGVLHIPPGFANGLRALETNSIIAVFSDFDVEKSIEGRRRYDKTKWFDWFQSFDKDKI